MLWANLDMTVNRTLLERGLPKHYYLENLLHQSAGVRELAKDTLQLVNTTKLVVNSYGAADLPGDFMDEVAVSLPIGQFLSEIPKRDDINPLRVTDSTGAFTTYADTELITEPFTFFSAIPVGWGFYWSVNDFGEPTGRFYGVNGGVSYGYQIFRERRQIQFTENLIGAGDIILIYVSNGQHADNATQIDFRAFRCIQTYSDWQRSPNAAFKDSPEAATFYNEKRLLRANMDDLTTTDIKQILRKNYKATMKS